MPRTKYAINEKSLTKGELRKLTALRKSLGGDIADEAFGKWYEQQESGGGEAEDPNVAVITKALEPHLGKMKFPRGGGYTLRRGRGRVIVEPLGD